MLGSPGTSALAMDVTGSLMTTNRNQEEKNQQSTCLKPSFMCTVFVQGPMELVPPAGLSSPLLTPSGLPSKR